MEYVKNLLSSKTENGKVQFAPDVAFVLDSSKPKDIEVGHLEDVKIRNSEVIGLNVSALLLHGGYTCDNMFGLKTDYRELMYSIIKHFMKDESTLVFLLPHVFGPIGGIESDNGACLEIYEHFAQKYSGRIFMVEGTYNQNQIKYIISLCDFFIGSRMHSCIAALSQCIPVVGLAYSKKFEGVFRSVSAEQSVVDMRSRNRDEILEDITEAYERRLATAEHLAEKIPVIREEVLKLFADIV